MFLKYFKEASLVSLLAIVLIATLGYLEGGVDRMLDYAFLAGVLGILEISLSVDNAVVNAKTLATMDALWRRRFIVWGIPVAVIGMRMIFPVLIVSAVGQLNPIDAVYLAFDDPNTYNRILHGSQYYLSGFGGTFLLLISLKYFIDEEKDSHWIGFIEKPLAAMGFLGITAGLALAIALIFTTVIGGLYGSELLIGSVGGFIAFTAVEAISEVTGSLAGSTAKAGIGGFIYLEVLDSSFSFDGVMGALALTTNIIVIAVGLGIGAMFVRSMTVMLVEEGTLTEYCYLEHGAFYAILFLAVVMFVKLFIPVPELVTGLTGVVILALAIWSSKRGSGKVPFDIESHNFDFEAFIGAPAKVLYMNPRNLHVPGVGEAPVSTDPYLYGEDTLRMMRVEGYPTETTRFKGPDQDPEPVA